MRILSPPGEPDNDTPFSRAQRRREVRGYIFFSLGLIGTLLLLWRLRAVLQIVYVSALFAVVLGPVVERVRGVRVGRWSPSRPLAVLLLVAITVSSLALLLSVALPPVLRDIHRFLLDLPERVPSLVARMQHFPLAETLGLDQIAEHVPALAGQSARFVLLTAPHVFQSILRVIFSIILTVYFLLEGETAYLYFLSFVPAESRERLGGTLSRAEVRMSKWLLGQLTLMLVLGITSTAVFALLHVRYYFLLGMLMGLFNIIPVAGGLITISLAAAVAALDSWGRMAGVLVFYAVYVQLESGFLTPHIMRTRVNLMGLSVLIALLAGTALAGIVGALVAVPTAALIGVLMEEYLLQKDAEAVAIAQAAEDRGAFPEKR